MTSTAPEEKTLDYNADIVQARGATLIILVAAIVIAELSKDVVFTADRGNWLPLCVLLYYGLMACLPFLLARMAPKAAGFDVQWLPISRWQWAWLVGLVFATILCPVFAAAVAAALVGHPTPTYLGYIGPVAPKAIICQGIVLVLVVPLAEEIFFRGYVLEQLRKILWCSAAILTQSLLFAGFHLYTRGLFTSAALFSFANTFLFGAVAGIWRVRFKSLLPLVLAHMTINALFGIPELTNKYDQVTGKLRPIHHMISNETTYLTGPLRKDGSVDYVAALNQHFSKGVTPQNNAAVLFWKAVGPEKILPEYRSRYFQMLGVQPLPEKGDYYVDLEKYLTQSKGDTKTGGTTSEPITWQDAQVLLDAVLKRPWSRQDHPELAAWLAANEKPLALLIEASRRPRRYDPLVCGEKTPLIAVFEPAMSVFHHLGGDVSGALLTQAMLRLGEAKTNESWETLLTCHRLARLVGQGPMLTEALVAQSLDGRACDADRAFLQHASLTAAQIAKMREDLDRLPPLPTIADKLDLAERFLYLNVVSEYSRQGCASLVDIERCAEMELIGAKELRTTVASLLDYSASTAIDWDIVLRMGNSWFDRIADAYRKPTRAAQNESLRTLDDDFRKLKKTAADTASLDKAILADRGKALSERLGQVILVMFSPRVVIEGNLENRATMTFELTKLAFALAAYRTDNGSYPARLADLVPKYVREVPKDVFNDAELHYRQNGKGYLLYSVGGNGKDDGGKGFENGCIGKECVEKNWDDLVLRIPAPASGEKKP